MSDMYFVSIAPSIIENKKIIIIKLHWLNKDENTCNTDLAWMSRLGHRRDICKRKKSNDNDMC